MGSISVVNTKKQMNNKVLVEVEVRTSVGRVVFPVTVADQGSLAQTEQAAYRELEKLLDEARELVQRQLS